MLHQFVRILGISFLDAGVEVALSRLEEGGLMVVPSGPGLATLGEDISYREAVANADFAIVDSAYLALLWLGATGKRLHRVSGLRFLRTFLHSGRGRSQGEILLVNPTEVDGKANVRLLAQHGFNISEESCYTAPLYPPGAVRDAQLVRRLEQTRPRYVMINIGGGTQEQLGHYLRQHLSFTPGIMCTGAAIAFLTGRQAKIPAWVDALGLGWLARSLQKPTQFVPRYMRAFKLAELVFRYKDALPALNPKMAG